MLGCWSLAAANFDGRKLTTSKHYGIDCINVLLSIMEQYVDGFRYHFEWQPTKNGETTEPRQFRITFFFLHRGSIYATGGGCVATELKDADHLDQTGADNRTSMHDRGCPSKKRTYDTMSRETGSCRVQICR